MTHISFVQHSTIPPICNKKRLTRVNNGPGASSPDEGLQATISLRMYEAQNTALEGAQV